MKRAGRSSIFLDASSASIMCARNMPAQRAKRMGEQRRDDRRGHKGIAPIARHHPIAQPGDCIPVANDF